MSRTTTAARRPETAQDARPVALAGLAIDARLDGAMSEFRIAQSFRNAEDQAIEAVYSFPLPAQAVLLDICVEIGDRRLGGDVVPLGDARETYEDAVAAGDGAFMLEQIQPGLFTLNAGNLRPGETARITYAFASVNRWSGDRLRVVLPTTIAPRFGHWSVAPHAVPETSLTVENRFSLRVALGPDLRAARLACPSHGLRAIDGDARDAYALADETAAMDRDIVLEVRHREPRPSFALLGQGIDGIVALASFQPFVPGLARDGAVDAVAVIDCSGSMAGTSIEQARQAMRAVLATLGRRDRLGMIAFGSTTRPLPGGRQGGTKTGLGRLGAFTDGLDADLGGTEIGAALDAAIAMAGTQGDDHPADIFLITDGQVANWEDLVERARRAGPRVFAVGVGHAAAEPFLSALAAATGGAAEFVTPDEAMAERIARHFERMRAPRATDIAIGWPEGATPLAMPAQAAIFEGDTLHAFATLPEAAIPGRVALSFSTEDGARHRLGVALDGVVAPGSDGLPSTLARLAAAARLADLPPDEATSLALAHRLLCPGTAWIVVDARAAEDRTDGMPALRTVPQMLAAGWGGTGGLLAACTEMPMALHDTVAPLYPPPTRRDAVAQLLAATAGDPPAGQIVHAAGLTGELDALRGSAHSDFVADLVCAAFEAGILAAMDDGAPEFRAARRRLDRQIAEGIARLHALLEHCEMLRRESASLLGGASADCDAIFAAVSRAHNLVGHAKQAGRTAQERDVQSRP